MGKRREEKVDVGVEGKGWPESKGKALWRQPRAALWWCLETTRNVKRKPMNHSEHGGNEP